MEDEDEEDIITLETAKLAKEKGFNEEELHYYFNGKLIQHPHRLYYNYNQHNPPLEQYSAPYQSFLQKWLREKYKIHIEINRDGDMWKYSLYEYSHENKHIPRGYPQFNSYEEALEIGLQEALKLINK